MAANFNILVLGDPNVGKKISGSHTNFYSDLLNYHAVIILFDFCNTSSFDNIKKWQNTIHKLVPVTVVGNKVDSENRTVQSITHDTFSVIEVSVKTNYNLQTALNNTLSILCPQFFPNTSAPIPSAVLTPANIHRLNELSQQAVYLSQKLAEKDAQLLYLQFFLQTKFPTEQTHPF